MSELENASKILLVSVEFMALIWGGAIALAGAWYLICRFILFIWGRDDR